MKQLIFVVFAFLVSMSFSGTSFAQQTPDNTVCNEKSGLSWEMNKEIDIDHYQVYVASLPDIAQTDPPVSMLIGVPHDPDSATILPDGSAEIVYEFRGTMSKGEKYFTVKAVDKSGNMSPHSNEVGCLYDTSPKAPVLKFIFTQPKP